MPPKAKKAPKDASEAVNGKGDKGAVAASAKPPAAPAKPAPTNVDATQEEADIKATTGTGKPDQGAYHAEQDKIKAEIDALQVKVVCNISILTFCTSQLKIVYLCSQRSRTRSL